MAALTVEQRDELADLMASAVAPHLVYAVYLEDPDRIADLLIPLDWQELLALTVVLAARCPNPAVRPDDNVIDETAVARACEGEPIVLTIAERLAAGRLLAAAGVGPTEAARRLHIAKTSAERILARAKPRPQQPLPAVTAEQAAHNRAVLETAVEEDPASPMEGTE